MKQKTISLILFLLMAFLSSGFTYNYNVPPTDATIHQKPLIEPIPTKMGCYSSDVFQTYESVKPLPLKPDISDRFRPGAANAALFDQVFSEMFAKVVKVSSFPPLKEDNADIKAVIEPKIVDVAVDADLNVTWIRVDLLYSVVLRDLKGADISNWSIKGSGSSVGYLKSINHPGMVRETTQLAMRNVAAKFMLGLRKNPEAMKWLRSTGIASSD